MSTIKCTNCGEVFDGDGVPTCPNCGNWVRAITATPHASPPDPLREWVPVSTPPTNVGRCGALIGNLEKCMKWDGSCWRYTDGRLAFDPKFTHWCAFPPLPTPKSAFETWWDGLPVLHNYDAQFYREVCGLPVLKEIARIIFEAGQAAKEGK